MKNDEILEPGEALKKINEESEWKVGSLYVGSSEKNYLSLEALLLDLDELQNKPRRLFDTLALIAYYNMKGAKREYVLDGINQWRSAMDDGVYGSVVRRAKKKKK